MRLVSKTGDGGSIKGNAVFKRARELRRIDGDVFLPAEYVAERKADKLHVFLLHILHDLLF